MRGKQIISAALAWMVAFLSVGVANAQSPTKDVIRLPVIRQEEKQTPPVPVNVDSTVKLSPEVIYVVESDVECLVFLSPGGAVKVTKEQGPLRFRGKFADGNGTTETRTFAGKFLYLFDAIKDGRDELIIVPTGAKAETDAKRVTFQVGTMPQPPPVDPVEPDDKKPKPKPKPVVTSFRIALVYESGQTMTAAQTNVLYGNVVEDWMTANCTGGKLGWRRRDKNAVGDADPTFAALWAAVKPKVTTVPCVAVEVNGSVEIIPFEATPAAMVAKLAEYKGK